MPAHKPVTNILHLTEGIVAHGCNAQGKFNSGFAKSVRETWPLAFDHYVQQQKKRGLNLGQIIPVQITPELLVINCVTQEFYGRTAGRIYVDYGAIAECFGKIRRLVYERGEPYPTINYPKVGAGLGGGNWCKIASIINAELGPLPHRLWIR